MEKPPSPRSYGGGHEGTPKVSWITLYISIYRYFICVFFRIVVFHDVGECDLSYLKATIPPPSPAPSTVPAASWFSKLELFTSILNGSGDRVA